MRSLAFALVFLGATVVAAPAARAGIEPCGNIQLAANAQCEVVVDPLACSAKCGEVSFTASCAADLYASCDGQCTATAQASCTTSCQSACEAECNAAPGSFDCEASCQADCEGSCAGACSAAANQAECQASCQATCSGECSASCSATAPSASCTAQCQACCSGSCTANANLSCQIACQADGYVECTTNLSYACELQCSKPEGALFCDGQYVDVGDDLKACLDYLETVLEIDVKGYASAQGECTAGAGGATCEGKAEAGLSCAIARPRSLAFPPLSCGLLFAAAAFAARRSRRR